MRIDDLGLAIVRLLQGDARISNKEIADRLAISEVTVAARIRDMEARDLLRIIIQRDLRALGFDLLVLLDIHVANRRPEEVAEEIAAIEEAVSVSLLLSEPDLIVNLHVRDRLHLLETIENKIAPIRGVAHWTADIALDVLKFDLRYGALGSVI